MACPERPPALSVKPAGPEHRVERVGRKIGRGKTLMVGGWEARAQRQKLIAMTQGGVSVVSSLLKCHRTRSASVTFGPTRHLLGTSRNKTVSVQQGHARQGNI